jgi:hypothetical protein
MSRRYVLIPVLVAIAVLVVALYPTESVTRRASAAPRAAVVTKYLMVPAAAFSVTEDGKDFINQGASMGFFSGSGAFVAPVYLPPSARIRTFRLYAIDLDPNFDICATFYQTSPKTGGYNNIKQVCTTGSDDLQQPYKNLSHYVKWCYGYTIRIEYSGHGDLSTYAVLLKYTVNQ